MQPGPYTAKIAHRRVFYAPEEKLRWNRMWEAWIEGGRTTPSVWQEFEILLTIPGFRFFDWHGGRFAESVVALELLRKGYTCSHACRLFRYGKKRGTWLEATKHIETLLGEAGLPVPQDFGRRIQPPPKNPDLAAHRAGKEWHFCEVKFNRDEQASQGQLVALAVLRELLDATVEVVRVVDEKYRQRPELEFPPYACDYTIT